LFAAAEKRDYAVFPKSRQLFLFASSQISL
jgi:hypothetical protein